MYLLPLARDARHRNEITRGSVLAPYVLVAATPVVLWAASNPLLAAGGLVAASALRRAIRWGRTRVRRLLRRRTVTVTLGRAVEVTVREPDRDGACGREACC